jgi:hypothetical protein
VKDTKNFTALFDFSDEVHAQLDDTHNGYRAQNSQVLDWLAMLSPEDMAEFKYKLSDEAKNVDMLQWETVRLVTKPILDWSERTLYGKSYTNCK